MLLRIIYLVLISIALMLHGVFGFEWALNVAIGIVTVVLIAHGWADDVFVEEVNEDLYNLRQRCIDNEIQDNKHHAAAEKELGKANEFSIGLRGRIDRQDEKFKHLSEKYFDTAGKLKDVEGTVNAKIRVLEQENAAYAFQVSQLSKDHKLLLDHLKLSISRREDQPVKDKIVKKKS